MWYNPKTWFKREKKLEDKDTKLKKELTEILTPLRRHLEYLAAYRCSKDREPPYKTPNLN